MPDPFKPVNPGDPIEPSAVAWNAMLAAGKAEKNRQLTQKSGSSLAGLAATIVRIKNGSGSNLARNTILGLDGSLFTPSDSEDAFLRAITFNGVVPRDAHHKRRYVVLIDPCLDGRFGRAYLAGVCQVKVNILDPAHGYAVIDDNRTDRLRSSWHGHARILWHEDESLPYGGYAGGVQWAIVMLGVTGSCVAVGKANGDINPRVGTTFGTGRVDLYRSDAGEADVVNETIDVLNASADTEAYGSSGISGGKYVAVAWDPDDTAWVSPLEC